MQGLSVLQGVTRYACDTQLCYPTASSACPTLIESDQKIDASKR